MPKLAFKHFSLFLLAILLLSPSFSQDIANSNLRISVSYFGEFITHPGIRLGLGKKLSDRKAKEGIQKSWIADINLTYYKHKRNHEALMVGASIGRERIGRKGLLSQLNLGLAYMSSFLDGEVYSWNGEEIIEGNRHSAHASFGINGGLGWDFGKNSSFPLAFLINPHLYFQAPYTSWLLPRIALEVKLIYPLQSKKS